MENLQIVPYTQERVEDVLDFERRLLILLESAFTSRRQNKIPVTVAVTGIFAIWSACPLSNLRLRKREGGVSKALA